MYYPRHAPSMKLCDDKRIRVDDTVYNLLTQTFDCFQTPITDGTIKAQKRTVQSKCCVLVTFENLQGVCYDFDLDKEFTSYYPTCTFQTMAEFNE